MSRVLIHELASGQFRPATKHERLNALTLENRRLSNQRILEECQRQLKLITESCKHQVVYDEPADSPACGGYTSRICVACGHVSLL